MMLRDFDSDAIVEETELLAAWIDQEIASPEEGYRVETPATAYVEDLTFSPNLELGNMSGGLVIRRVRALLARQGVPFVFLGRSVKVARAVAQAHALLPERQRPAGIDFSAVR